MLPPCFTEGTIAQPRPRGTWSEQISGAGTKPSRIDCAATLPVQQGRRSASPGSGRRRMGDHVMEGAPEMRSRTTLGHLFCAAAVSSSPLLSAIPAEACTRLVYAGPNGTVITARSMDWKSDILSNLWIVSRGMERSGEAGPNSIRWRSEFGSVVVSGSDVSTTDGVNEAGLEANLLWLIESNHPPSDA
jgi:hypothetical protein